MNPSLFPFDTLSRASKLLPETIDRIPKAAIVTPSTTLSVAALAGGVKSLKQMLTSNYLPQKLACRLPSLKQQGPYVITPLFFANHDEMS
jgi:hypothetical protein